MIAGNTTSSNQVQTMRKTIFRVGLLASTLVSANATTSPAIPTIWIIFFQGSSYIATNTTCSCMNRVIEPTIRDHYKQVHKNYHGDPALELISIAFMWLDSVEQDHGILQGRNSNILLMHKNKYGHSKGLQTREDSQHTL